MQIQGMMISINNVINMHRKFFFAKVHIVE